MKILDIARHLRANAYSLATLATSFAGAFTCGFSIAVADSAALLAGLSITGGFTLILVAGWLLEKAQKADEPALHLLDDVFSPNTDND